MGSLRWGWGLGWIQRHSDGGGRGKWVTIILMIRRCVISSYYLTFIFTFESVGKKPVLCFSFFGGGKYFRIASIFHPSSLLLWFGLTLAHFPECSILVSDSLGLLKYTKHKEFNQ